MNQGQQSKPTQQHITNDFVPTTMVKGSNNLKESEDQLARLIGLTNEKFSEMGVTTSYGKKPNAGNKKADLCAGCGREVIGKQISALDAQWHPACFQCSQCCKPVFDMGGSSSFIVRNNKPWCTKCDDFDRKERASRKAAIASTTPGGGSDGSGGGGGGGGGGANSKSNAETARKNQDQLDAHNNIQMGKEFCAACNKAIMGEAVDYKSGTVQQFFHVACFRCAHCLNPVDNVAEGFQHYKQKIYHPACYKQIIGHGPCGGCGQNITTKYVQPEPGGTKFHAACFACSVPTCKAPLASGFLQRDGAYYCQSCANERFTVSTNITGQKMTGFKVDPMTHKKIATTTYTMAPNNTPAAKVTTTVTMGTGAGATTSVKKNFCTNCGAQAQGGKFCSGCGKPL